jgi:hypothetical protein
MVAALAGDQARERLLFCWLLFSSLGNQQTNQAETHHQETNSGPADRQFWKL